MPPLPYECYLLITACSVTRNDRNVPLLPLKPTGSVIIGGREGGGGRGGGGGGIEGGVTITCGIAGGWHPYRDTPSNSSAALKSITLVIYKKTEHITMSFFITCAY